MKKKAWSLVLVAAMLIAAVIIAIPNAKAEATPEYYPDTYPEWHCECGNIWADPKHNDDAEAPTTDLHYMYGEGKCKHEGSSGCDGTLYKWTAFAGTSMATTGNYYLTANFAPGGVIYVGNYTAGSALRIDLNGYKIQKALGRLFTNNASGTTKGKGDLVILDSSKDNTGAVINTIPKPSSAQGNIYWKSNAGKFNVYNAKLATPNIVAAPDASTNDGQRYGGEIVYTTSSGSVNFFDCEIIAGDSYGKVSTTVHGGNAIYATSGAVNVIGGSITGGKNTVGYGGAIWVKGATLTMRNCTVSGGSAAKGGNIYVSGAKNVTLENVTLTGGKVGEKAEDIRFEGTGVCKITGSSTVERAVFDADVAASAAYDLTGLTADSNVTLEVVTTDAEKDITASVIAKNVTEEMSTYVHIANAAPGEGEVYYLSTDGTLKLGKIQCECGGTLAGTEGHTCERKLFLPVDSSNIGDMFKQNGTSKTQMVLTQNGDSYFYLKNNVNLSETGFSGMYLFLNGSKVLHLDLNGHKLDMGAGYVSAYTSGMTICDSIGTGEFTSSKGTLQISHKDANANAFFTVYGGKVTSSGTGATVVNVTAGTINIYGGEIRRHESIQGESFTTAVITMAPGSGKDVTVNMYGGTITGSVRSKAGGSVALATGATLNLYGGTITGGSATGTSGNGGNITTSGTVNVFGGQVTGGNAAVRGGNIYVGTNGTLNVYDGTITGGIAGADTQEDIATGNSENAVVEISGGTVGYVNNRRGSMKITGSANVQSVLFDVSDASFCAYNFEGLTAAASLNVQNFSEGNYPLVAENLPENYSDLITLNDEVTNAGYELRPNGRIAPIGTNVQCECGGEMDGIGGHTCELKVFLPVTQANLEEVFRIRSNATQMEPIAVGDSYYYLAGNINLADSSTFAGKYLLMANSTTENRTLHLDLNGYKLDMGTGYARAYNSGMTICDSVGTGEFTSSKATLQITKNDKPKAFFTVYGGKVSATGTERAVYLLKGTVNVYGGKVTATTLTNSVVEVGGACALNIYGGEICRDESVKDETFSKAVVGLTATGATVNMDGGTITGSLRSNAGGSVALATGAQFNMNGGTITGGSSMYNAGNVAISGTFTMTGGTISNGKSDANGGNIFVGSGGKLDFQGGTIENGTADKGGNVFVYAKVDDATKYGTFTMGGTAQITGGTAREIGSGVYANGEFTMDGGAVTGGTARNGSVKDAVVAGIRKVTLNGGTITGTDYALTVVGGSVTTGEEAQWLDELTIGGVTLTAPTQVYFLNGDPAFDVTHMVIPTGTFTAAAQVSGKNISVGAGNADAFVAVFGGQKVDDDTVVFTAANVANDGTNDFNTVQAAVDSNATVITLKSGVQENIDAAGKTFTLLLNGNVIYGNIQNAENVTFVDTTSTLDVAGSGRIYGTIENAPVASYNAGKRYMVIPHEAEGYYTVDRFYYSVTKVTQHANGEMGFIANFAGNENVTQAAANGTFRFEFTLVENGQNPADSTWLPSNSRTGLTLTSGYDGSNLNVIVEGVWTTADDDVLTNKSIAVRPVFTANEQEVKMNYRVASMKNICVQLVNAANDSMNEQQLGGLRTLYNAHKTLIESWTTVPDVLKNAQ